MHAGAGRRHAGGYRQRADLHATTTSTACARVVAAHRGDVAAIIVSPFRHDAFHDQELPVEGFLPGVRRLCDEQGIVFILDDVRAGFRLHLGGSGERFGVRPDLACYAKALANGYPLSACVGREALKAAAERVYFTGSYFTSAVPMAAALACLRELEASAARIAHMERVGLLLRARARGAGRAVTASRSSIPARPRIPFMSFKDDVKFAPQPGLRRRLRRGRRLPGAVPQLVPVGRAQRKRHRPHT